MMLGVIFALVSAMPAQPVPAVTAPASIGRPHSCAENQYPVTALQTGAEGDTLMGFKITPQGGVKDVSVLTSSGNPDLDAASMACARDWLYQPAMQNGVAVEVPWKARVRWQIGVSEEFDPIDKASYRCLSADPSVRDLIKQTSLHTVVRVHFSNGTLGSVTVVASSGIPLLDQQVLACYQNISAELVAAIPGETDELFVAILPPS